MRAERYEPKNIQDRRGRRFAGAALELIRKHAGFLFAHGYRKPVGLVGHSEVALYNSTVQGVLRQFERFLLNHAGQRDGIGIVVMDQRNARLNETVLSSAQSYLATQGFVRIVESPLLVPSEWYHGVQLADTTGRAVSALFQWRGLKSSKHAWAEPAYGALVDNAFWSDGRGFRTIYLK